MRSCSGHNIPEKGMRTIHKAKVLYTGASYTHKITVLEIEKKKEKKSEMKLEKIKLLKDQLQ